VNTVRFAEASKLDKKMLEQVLTQHGDQLVERLETSMATLLKVQFNALLLARRAESSSTVSAGDADADQDILVPNTPNDYD
jgi:hypothetical protein